jgi:amino acid permease
VTLTIWIVIGLCSIRVRSAMKVQGIVPSRLPWAAPLMPYLAHITVWGSLLVLMLEKKSATDQFPGSCESISVH